MILFVSSNLLGTLNCQSTHNELKYHSPSFLTVEETETQKNKIPFYEDKYRVNDRTF